MQADSRRVIPDFYLKQSLPTPPIIRNALCLEKKQVYEVIPKFLNSILCSKTFRHGYQNVTGSLLSPRLSAWSKPIKTRQILFEKPACAVSFPLSLSLPLSLSFSLSLSLSLSVFFCAQVISDFLLNLALLHIVIQSLILVLLLSCL